MLGLGLGRFAAGDGGRLFHGQSGPCRARCRLLLRQFLPLVQVFPVDLAALCEQVGPPLRIGLDQARQLFLRLLGEADGSHVIPLLCQSGQTC